MWERFGTSCQVYLSKFPSLGSAGIWLKKATRSEYVQTSCKYMRDRVARDKRGMLTPSSQGWAAVQPSERDGGVSELGLSCVTGARAPSLTTPSSVIITWLCGGGDRQHRRGCPIRQGTPYYGGTQTKREHFWREVDASGEWRVPH